MHNDEKIRSVLEIIKKIKSKKTNCRGREGKKKKKSTQQKDRKNKLLSASQAFYYAVGKKPEGRYEKPEYGKVILEHGLSLFSLFLLLLFVQGQDNHDFPEDGNEIKKQIYTVPDIVLVSILNFFNDKLSVK